jgi:hypothetical protein
VSTGKATLDKLLTMRTRHPRGQFGQTDDESTLNGVTACGHTCLQDILFAYKGLRLSQDQISRVVGYWARTPDRGLHTDEVQRILSHYGVSYTVKTGLSSGELLTASNIGPVLLVIRYGNWPNWYKYRGTSPPAPFARPLGKGGRNQFSGFFGSHFVLELGYVRKVDSTGKFLRNDVYAMEPNHDSPARSENVPYDVVTQTDFYRAFSAVKQLGWSNTLALVPNRRPTFPGGLG